MTRMRSWLRSFFEIRYFLGRVGRQTHYKLFKTDLLKSLPLACSRFEFCPEVTALVAKQGIKIPEVPIAYHPRTTTQGKKINWRDGLEAIWTLIKFRFVGIEKSTARWCLGLALIFAALVAVFDFSVAGLYQRDGDTTSYVNMINFFAGRPLAQADIPYHRLIKPMYGLIGAAASPFVSPENTILILNLIFYFGIVTILFFLLKRHLKFAPWMATLGTAWFACSYPMLKTGFMLITDLSGWFFTLLTVLIALEAENKNRDSLLFIAGLSSAVGLIGKETGSMGMLFVFFFYLLQVRKAGWARTVKRWFFAGLPFVLITAAVQYGIFAAWHYSYYDWMFRTADITSNQLRLPIYFIGTQIAAFHVLWIYFFLGLLQIRKQQGWKVLISLVPVGLSTYIWIIYLVRILFFQFVFIIPFSLLGWETISNRMIKHKFSKMLLSAILPQALSIALFLFFGQNNAFKLLHLAR